MKFNKVELKKIKANKIFKKGEFWIKPIKESDYEQGDIKAHKTYFRILKRYLKGHLPKIKSKKIKINDRFYLINKTENIKGNLISNKELSKNLKLKINNRLKKGMESLLRKGYVLDFYGKKNFVQKKDKKIYYIDLRMPLFTKSSNEGGRFDLSKKRTIQLLK